jgi:hypothetical protein
MTRPKRIYGGEQEKVQGGQYGVDVLADEPGGAPRQVESLFDRVDRVEHLLEASHLNAGGNR